MNKFLLCALLSVTSLLRAQNDSIPISISKNHYSFSLVNGISLTKAEPAAGAMEMKKGICISHGLNFQYTRNFTQNFSLSGTAGFGFLPFIFNAIAKDSASGTESPGYFHRGFFQVYSNFALHVNYRNKISSKYAYQIHAGLGVKNFPVSYYEYGLFNQLGTDISHYYKGQFYGGASPYAAAGASIIKTLRNKDEISLRLSYEQSFRDIYGGEYQLYDNSHGKFSNSGSNFNLALNYTFTGVARKERLDKLSQTDFPDRKSARKQYRKEIRYIDPKSSFITVSAALGFGINRTKDDGNKLSSGAFLSFLPRITYEKGIASNYFAEAGFHTLEYWDILKLRSKDMSMGGNAFFSYQFSVGGGKRLITRNNYNVITLHAGLTLGYTNITKGYQGFYSTYLSSVDDGGQETLVISAVSEQYAYHRFITSAYLGASKDFRITKRFYLALSYRYQQGFYKVYEQKVGYITAEQPEIQRATITINGSSHAFEFGVKVKL